MDNFLQNNWNGYNFGRSLNDIANYNGRDGWYTNDPYFFLERELVYKNKTQWQNAKNHGLIRHLKPYNGKWLDYVVHKEFNTLAEWVADCGDSLKNILYGVNRVHQTNYNTQQPHQPKFICLGHLLEVLGHVENPVTNDTFTHIINLLGATKAVSPKGMCCLVKRPDGTIVIARVMDKRFDALDSDDGEPNIVISVPMNNGSMKDYYRLSDVPTGTEVYFKTTEDEFCPVNSLL